MVLKYSHMQRVEYSALFFKLPVTIKSLCRLYAALKVSFALMGLAEMALDGIV